jgi:hypothetical protein
MSTTETTSSPLSHDQLQAFPGFPYLITRIAPAIYHINLLPLDGRYGFYRLLDIARRQIDANRLRACLVVGEDKALYFEPDGREIPSAYIPHGGRIESGRLVLCEPLPETEDLAIRGDTLSLFAAGDHPDEGTVVLFGDLTKGGRRPTEEEGRTLRGQQENGAPLGLERCPACGEWRGECFDTLELNADLIVRVRCVCENDTRCAGCRRPFDARRIESNYYSETDGSIWHVPAFAALSHSCSGTPKEVGGRRFEVVRNLGARARG